MLSYCLHVNCRPSVIKINTTVTAVRVHLCVDFLIDIKQTFNA